MKTDILKTFVAPIFYRWRTPHGRVCRARSVVLARRRRDLPRARERFFQQNPHVQEDTVQYAYD